MMLYPFHFLVSSTRSILKERKGFILWYLLGAVAAIGVFYLIYFLFWAQIKGWFVNGH